MPCSGWSALHGVNPNSKIVQHKKKLTIKFKKYAEWNFFIWKKKAIMETISVAINDSSDLLIFDLYLINKFVKPMKVHISWPSILL